MSGDLPGTKTALSAAIRAIPVVNSDWQYAFPLLACARSTGWSTPSR